MNQHHRCGEVLYEIYIYLTSTLESMVLNIYNG
jgi:hypothetical protein